MHAGKSPTCHDQQLYLQISADGVHLKAASRFNGAFFARRLSSSSIGGETILMPNLLRRSLRENRQAANGCRQLRFRKVAPWVRLASTETAKAILGVCK
jgi:hypothetical protein